MNTAALRVLQFGAIAIVFAVSPNKARELDRFLVPKEIVLHATAAIALVVSLTRLRITRRDWLVVGFLVLSAISAAMASNHVLAFRALAVSVSAFVIYLVARTEPRAIDAVALAVVLAAATSLVQAYGVEIDFFAEKRAPGGTLGNRNFVGHVAAFGLPILLLLALRGSRLAPIGIAVVSASLVLTRSRAAWLAAAAALIVFLFATGKSWRRNAIAVLFAAAGIAAAILIPNALRWRSDNPYRDSLEGVVSYEEGSGRGRLIQYERSLRMAAAHPVFGVGPGNWPVMYPKYAARRDPSLDRSKWKTTYNPWPSSDWIAYIAERGFGAAALLAAFFASLVFRRFREPEDGALVAMIAAVCIAGALDAVLLLALPAMLVWAGVGALEARYATLTYS